jgi:hypothetical protein
VFYEMSSTCPKCEMEFSRRDAMLRNKRNKHGTTHPSHTSLGRTVGPFTGGNKVLSDVHEGKRCLDRHENVVSDMVSPMTCKIKVRNVLFVCFTYAHVEYIMCALQSSHSYPNRQRGKTCFTRCHQHVQSVK